MDRPARPGEGVQEGAQQGDGGVRPGRGCDGEQVPREGVEHVGAARDAPQPARARAAGQAGAQALGVGGQAGRHHVRARAGSAGADEVEGGELVQDEGLRLRGAVRGVRREDYGVRPSAAAGRRRRREARRRECARGWGWGHGSGTGRGGAGRVRGCGAGVHC